MRSPTPLEKRRFAETLSLVLQGPLFKNNVAAVAETCRAWRTVLPLQPMILAVSESDFLRPADIHQLGPRRRRSGQVDWTPLDLIREACDAIVIAPPAKSLPPVKAGLKANHVNFQIAAAQAGLARVQTEHVLRVRHDLAFRDDGFIDHYLERRRLPRGDEAILGERVMISPFFTLDPFTLERLPFHYSDWFHLGCTTDVRGLWNIAPMRRTDATYYRRHPMRAESGNRERLFKSRWGAEQYMTVQALAGLGRPVLLDRHDDPTDAALSLKILADNYVIADFGRTPVDFAKYAHLAAASDIGLLCVSDGDLMALVEARGHGDPGDVLTGKRAAAAALLAIEARRKRSTLRRMVRRVLG